MATYTLKQLSRDGPQYAMAMLLQCLNAGEPFVTYGAIGDELQHQLKVGKIFPTQIGYVAGSLMDRILEIEPDAPLINVLITRPDGIPGVGAGEYLAYRYRERRYRNWKNVPTKEKLEVVAREREKIFNYRKWGTINEKLFGNNGESKLRVKKGSEVDGRSKNGMSHGGPAESDEHKKLKAWVASNPSKVGLAKSFGKGTPEAPLLSGDTIDVLFSDGNDYVVVEVKSCRSNDDDLRRGIYQCVKYRTVKEAEHAPNKVNVRALLIGERKMNAELMTRARLLKVKYLCVAVNTNG
ncbi:hypothetical protein RIE95_02180 [Acidithiobacillus thiooxidans]|uniref:hypothetical protein n=1 Tax=Acidithiobacillus thiooxidans TaxID=930 RepID=UPI0028580A7A|nr:hypothetical protein [Acidithiobacillus thiooxidans]MDR7925813.1 hypothetical protein [Acidithiobacillus thiooxidans]